VDGLATRPDPAVARFFPAFAVPPVLYERLRSAQDYFFSAYGNTLSDLLLFTLGVSALFYGRAFVRHRQLRRHRRRIPVVIGGWGTRGKSGTERLKAAMLSGLGYGVVCKTTGCESMFLYGKPFQDLEEMFLFRPYDKASIHEQAFVVSMASRLRTDVFLWECMALSPPLVRILQRQWMHDDLSTLTNAFPDHEDIQGPAGHDIPRVMTNFIPRGRVLYTSEENMLPILAEGAREMGTTVRRVTWLESGLLTADVLGRFRFQEHPDNVALVLAIAEDLGVDRDYAVKEMADRVVADLGVLKTFPEADVAGRRLRFTNGMSANEPFGALSNWKRVGFAAQDPESAPGEWITAVVNNRADRVARSHVFAQLIAEELPADRYFLIGGNLSGLQGYLRDAVRKATGSITLGGDRRRAEEVLVASARRFRLCVAREQVATRVAAMLNGVGAPLPADPSTLAEGPGLDRALRGTEHERWLAEMEAHRAAWAESVREVRELLERIRDPRVDPGSLDEEVRAFLSRSFERKLHVVDDYFAPGDKLIQIVAAATPPGFRNRCMGIQNIKGTGLDFVYRFLAWESCHAICERVLDRDDDAALKALDELSAFRDFGLLSEAKVRDTLQRCLERAAFQDPPVRDQLARLRAQLDERLATVREGIARSGAPGLKDRALALVETLLDTLDGLHRRRTASKIYRDILAGRISRVRAMEELRRLTKRQYGGWLRGKA
jgi:poly-gamma-glutamate synthase PgsB/CapB